jgi:methionine biosynthesis protein MetW
MNTFGNNSVKQDNKLSSPDEHGAGLVGGTLDPLRYGGQIFDPDEASGIITQMIPAGARVLDVGCGTGSLTQIVRSVCDAEILGVEPDPSRVEKARSRGVNVREGYLDRQLIVELGRFDILLFADILEHLPNPQAMLLLARDALKPGGSIIISVPNVAHWSVRANLLRGNFHYEPSGIMDATHLRWFTIGTIKSLIISAGFKVTEYRASAGTTVIDNQMRRPLRWLSPALRSRFLRFSSKRWPTLFGSQHVLKAEMV